MTIFFDLDGPILDVRRRHHEVHATGVRSLGGTVLDPDEFWELKRSRTSDEELLQRSDLEVASTLESYRKHRLQHLETEASLRMDLLQPGMAALLRELAPQHRLCLVTVRRNRPALERQLDWLRLTPHFHAILSGQEASIPAWQVKSALVRQGGIPFQTGDWIIGDTETEIQTGRELCLRTVAVTNGIRNEELLRAHKPDFLLPSADKFRQIIYSWKSHS